MKAAFGCYQGSMSFICDAVLYTSLSKYKCGELLLLSTHRDPYKVPDKRNVGGFDFGSL
jgi:SET domain-containing protein